MTIKLSVRDYDDAEIRAKRQIGVSAIAAYSPSHFLSRGFVTNISDVSELWRYVDSMHTQRFIENLNSGLGGGLKPHEFELLKTITDEVIQFSTAIGHPLTGRNTTTRALISVRVLETLESVLGQRPLTILNLGDGCGYLSRMLAEAGHRAICMDVTQVFYLYQNNFLADVLGERFIELATAEDQNEWPRPGCVTHLPWWRFIDRKLELPKLDVVFANHMLSEMDPIALHHAFSIMKRANEHYDQAPPMLICDGLGGEFSRYVSAISSLRQIGFYIHFHGPIYDLEEPDYAITCLAPEAVKTYQFASSRQHIERLMGRLLSDEEWRSWSKKTFTKYEALRLASIRAPFPSSHALAEMEKNRGFSVTTGQIADYMLRLCKDRCVSFFTDDELFERSYGRIVEFKNP
jgi:SAM-dependent methyltransferase